MKIFAKRKWDDSIWAIIKLATTIFIAVWLVWLLVYFYNSNRENTAMTAVAFSSNSTISEIAKVIDVPTTLATVASTTTSMDYSALDGVYTLTFTDADDTDAVEYANAYRDAIKSVAKDINAAWTAVVTYKVK